jgi:hypothetical protein
MEMDQENQLRKLLDSVSDSDWRNLEKAISLKTGLILLPKIDSSSPACYASDSELNSTYRIGFSTQELHLFLLGYLAEGTIDFQSLANLLTQIQEIKLTNSDEFWKLVERGKQLK